MSSSLNITGRLLGQSGVRLSLFGTVMYVDSYLSNSVQALHDANFIRQVPIPLHPIDITDAGIEPAAIDTEMLRAGFHSDPVGYQQLKVLHPLGRIGRRDEVARLASAVSDGGMNFLNGVCVQLNGGISARLVDSVA